MSEMRGVRTFYSENMKIENRLGDLGVGTRIILK
jgi:hypothetical protein